MSMKIGIRAWIDFAFRNIFGKPGNEMCLIGLLHSVLQLPRPVVSIEYLNPVRFSRLRDRQTGLMGNLWDDKQLHHQFQLVTQLQKRLRDRTAEIDK